MGEARDIPSRDRDYDAHGRDMRARITVARSREVIMGPECHKNREQAAAMIPERRRANTGGSRKPQRCLTTRAAESAGRKGCPGGVLGFRSEDAPSRLRERRLSVPTGFRKEKASCQQPWASLWIPSDPPAMTRPVLGARPVGIVVLGTFGCTRQLGMFEFDEEGERVCGTCRRACAPAT